MIAIDVANAIGKLIFRFNNIGKTTNNEREGITNQKILFDKLITFSMSFVSTNNQMNARIDNNGSEANSPPIKLLVLEISLTNTIIMADMITFSI